MSSRHPLAVLLVVLALGATACGRGATVESRMTPLPTGGTLVAAVAGDEPGVLDPHLAEDRPARAVTDNVYETLVRLDNGMRPEPALASDWQVSDDLRTWTFTLVEGITFHDGRPLEATDVVASLERIADEGLGSSRLADVVEVRAPTPARVEIELREPTQELLGALASGSDMAIVPADAIEDGSLVERPVGTGPFRFVGRGSDGAVVLEAHEDYWDDSGPYVDGIEIRFVDEGSVRLPDLRFGEIDWTNALHPVDARRTKTPGVTIRSAPGTAHVAIALNHRRDAFADVRVRRALAYALHRERVASASEQPATASQTALPWRFGVRHSPFSHNPRRAQELLEAAGVDNLELELLVPSEHEAAALEVIAQWAEIGVTAAARVVNEDTLTAVAERGDFDAVVVERDAGVERHVIYYEQHHSSGEANIQGYANDDVDELLEAARSEADEHDREDLLAEAIRMIVDEVSHLYLFNPDRVEVWQEGVRDHTVRPDGALRFVDVRLLG